MKKTILSITILSILASMLVPAQFVITAVLSVAVLGYLASGKFGVAKSTLDVGVWDALNAALLKRNENRNEAVSFLKSFFRTENVNTTNVAFNTRKNGKKVSVDTNIQTKGRHHKRQVGKLSVIQPPLYWEWTDLQLKDLYNGILGNNVSPQNIYDFSGVINTDLNEMADDIERAYELQCAQILTNGIIQLRNNDNVDYGRSANSIVNATAKWSSNPSSIFSDINAGVKWIRSNSNNNSVMYDLILGETAFSNFISSTELKDRNDVKHFQLDEIKPGGVVPSGGAYWGTITLESGVKVNVWSYDKTYEADNATDTSYITATDAFIIPQKNNLVWTNAAVKFLDGTPNVGSFRGFATNDFLDFNNQVHYYHLRGRGIAIPQEINEIYTIATEQ